MVEWTQEEDDLLKLLFETTLLSKEQIAIKLNELQLG